MDEDKIDFARFKLNLRSFEENEKSRLDHMSNQKIDSVLKVENKEIVCFSCNEVGHKSFQCVKNKEGKNYNKRWCNNCKVNSHDTNFCRKKVSMKMVKSTEKYINNLICLMVLISSL